MRLVRGDPGRQQPDALGDALDVAVDGHEGHPEREQQHDRGGLETHPIDAREPCACLERRHVAKELERVITAFLAQASQRGLDAGGLLLRQAAGTDGQHELMQGRPLHRQPVGRQGLLQAQATPTWPGRPGLSVGLLRRHLRREACAQGLEGLFGVHVSAVLREDGEDELGGGVMDLLPWPDGIGVHQRPKDVIHEPRTRSVHASRPGARSIDATPTAAA